MMKKSNKILIGCLALLLAMSVGYALFSDAITINGSATAKGDFELTTEIVDLEEAEWWIPSFAGLNPSKGIVEDPVITVNDNVVTTSVTLGAPGSYQYFAIKVTNTGTIPAKLKSIQDSTTGAIYLSQTEYVGSIENCIGEANKNMACTALYLDSGWSDDYTSDIAAGERWMEATPFEGMLDAVLDPGEEAYYFIYSNWGYNSTVPGDPIMANLSVKLNWEQVTE